MPHMFYETKSEGKKVKLELTQKEIQALINHFNPSDYLAHTWDAVCEDWLTLEAAKKDPLLWLAFRILETDHRKWFTQLQTGVDLKGES